METTKTLIDPWNVFPTLSLMRIVVPDLAGTPRLRTFDLNNDKACDDTIKSNGSNVLLSQTKKKTKS